MPHYCHSALTPNEILDVHFRSLLLRLLNERVLDKTGQLTLTARAVCPGLAGATDPLQYSVRKKECDFAPDTTWWRGIAKAEVT